MPDFVKLSDGTWINREMIMWAAADDPSPEGLTDAVFMMPNASMAIVHYTFEAAQAEIDRVINHPGFMMLSGEDHDLLNYVMQRYLALSLIAQDDRERVTQLAARLRNWNRPCRQKN